MKKDLNNCRAAFGQTDITPDFPVEMIGCYREDNRPDGVLHPLFAQVLLFESGNERNCLIAIDNLGLTVALAAELRALVAEAVGTAPTRVMLNFSHTHAAPSPTSPLNGARYFALLCERLVACAVQALARLQPCLVGWSVGETAIGENRREGCRTADKRLGALQVADAVSKTPIMVLLRVCAHANILMTQNSKISSDYIGLAREKLSAYWGCPVMLIQGASGNLKPAGVDKIAGGGVADVERIAGLLLQSARQLCFEPREVTRLLMYEKAVELYSDIPPLEEAERIAFEAQTRFGIAGTAWLAECARLREAGVTSQTQQGSIHFLFLNEGCLCGVADEIFCELALAAAEKAQASLLFFNGYTNGCGGYLPHLEEWLKGGYETLYSYLTYYAFHGHLLPFRANTAENLVEAVVKAWQQVFGVYPRGFERPGCLAGGLS